LNISADFSDCHMMSMGWSTKRSNS